MPTFFDSTADAAEASEALRGLAHASRSFDQPAEMYGVICPRGCGRCGRRSNRSPRVCNAKSSQGTIYPHFVCASRHGGRGNCTRQAMLYARFDEMMAEGTAELADLASRRTQLEGEQQKLLQAH